MVQKNLPLMLAVCVCAFHAEAQTGKWKLSYNKSRVYTSADTWLDKVEYENGLGDVVQRQDLGLTPQGKDLVTLTEYDDFRRVSKAWLPVVMQTGGDYVRKVSEIAASAQKQAGGDARPFTEYTYVASPQGEVDTKQLPGEDWKAQGKNVKCIYGILSDNDENYDILHFATFLDETVNCFPSVRKDLKYKETIDEDGRVVVEYFDVDGQKVLERKVAGKDKVDTYYLYDYNGNVACVMPEGLVEFLRKNFPNRSLDDDIPEFKSYAYRYKYDSQGHCIYKRLPGCEPVYYVYDKMGHCIFSQDGEQRDRGEWRFTIPDRFGREVLRGVCKNVLDYRRSPLEGAVVVATAGGGNDGSTFGHSIAGVNLVSPSVQMAVFYDNYTFLGKFGFPSTLSYLSPGAGFRSSCFNARGLLTGQAKALFGEPNGTSYIYTSLYYDDKGQVIQKNSTTSQLVGSQANQYGVEQDSYAYSYTGKVLRHNHVHKGTTCLTEDYTYSYDHADRLLLAKYAISDNPEVTLFSNTYDELGRLQHVKLHGDDKLQISYSYNVRSWLTGISSGSRFQEDIYYNESRNSNVPCYGGNISSMDWKTEGKTRGYNFEYDDLSRLIKAQYLENGSKSSHYSTSYTYDKMGNVTGLHRNGLQDGGTYGLIDDLTYLYDGNQVVKIDDKVEAPTYNGVFNFMDGADEEKEYEYDKNGNLVKDLNKKISKIEYNSLNLPWKVEFEDGKSVEYLYDASGVKHQATYFLNPSMPIHKVIYSGNMIYVDSQLYYIQMDGGHVKPIFTSPMPSFSFHYYIKDHLGSNRVVVDSNGNVEQVNHYYPFGGLMVESFGYTSLFKYNGKELDRMNGLDWYDYGARWYDAGVGKWFNIDPMLENYVSCSPYLYCLDNPINAIDNDGKRVRTLWFKDDNHPIWYKSAPLFRTAMLYFAKTQFGKQLFADFTPKGSYFFGVEGNGKYANYDLILYEISDSNPQSRTAYFNGLNAQSSMVEDIEGKPAFSVVFDVERPMESLLETITHELAGHLNKYHRVLNSYEKSGKYKSARDEWNKMSEKDDHENIKNGNNKTFQNTIIELLKMLPYIKDFKFYNTL